MAGIPLVGQCLLLILLLSMLTVPVLNRDGDSRGGGTPAAGAAGRSSGSVRKLGGRHAGIRGSVGGRRRTLRRGGTSIGGHLRSLLTLGATVTRRRGGVQTVRARVAGLGGGVGLLRARLRALRGRLRRQGRGCVGSLECVAHRRSFRSGLVFVFSSRAFNRTLHQLQFIGRCTSFRQTRKRVLGGGRRRIRRGGDRLLSTEQERRRLLSGYRNRHRGLRRRGSRRRGVIGALRGRRGDVRKIVSSRGGGSTTLGTRVRGLVTRRVTHRRRVTQRGTTTRTRTGQGTRRLTHRGTRTREVRQRGRTHVTTTGTRRRQLGTRTRGTSTTRGTGTRRGTGRTRTGHITTRGGTATSARHDAGTITGTRRTSTKTVCATISRGLSSGFRDGGKQLPVPVAKRCHVIDRFKRCGIRNLANIALSGGNVGVLNAGNYTTEDVFSKRISTITGVNNACLILIHRKQCVSICYGLGSMSIGGKRGISANRRLKLMKASGVLRFRLHGRATGLGPRI